LRICDITRACWCLPFVQLWRAVYLCFFLPRYDTSAIGRIALSIGSGGAKGFSPPNGNRKTNSNSGPLAYRHA